MMSGWPLFSFPCKHILSVIPGRGSCRGSAVKPISGRFEGQPRPSTSDYISWNGHTSFIVSHHYVSVEMIETIINCTKLGKACGPDNLSIEHLKYSHVVLLIHLKLLFSAIFAHNFVPDDFGSGIIVPLVKDKTGNINSVDNYTPMTLTPVVSKVFEGVLLRLCENYLVNDELQFGFKSGLSCSDAIFALRAITNHFISNGSSVFIARG